MGETGRGTQCPRPTQSTRPGEHMQRRAVRASTLGVFQMADPTDLAKQVADVTKSVGDLQTAANIVWTLVTGFLVMFMQLGFALLETGLTRAKNVTHTMGMNIFVYAIGILCFWLCGFAFQMGGVGALATFGNDPTLANEFT